jgi:hypothetical protein
VKNHTQGFWDFYSVGVSSYMGAGAGKQKVTGLSRPCKLYREMGIRPSLWDLTALLNFPDGMVLPYV